MPGHPSGTVTFLFADVDDEAGVWEVDAAGARHAPRRYDELLIAAVEGQGGYVFKRIGRAYQIAFATVTQALQGAAAAQRALYAEPAGQAGSLRVRMALHTGVTSERDGEYVGPLLNRVARVLAAGYGGQILLTEATQALARDGLPAGMDLRDLGEHRLRDLARSEHIFQLVVPNLPDDFPALRTLTGHPSNLPLQPTPLIGRDQAVQDCLALLRRTEVRLLTLSGPGAPARAAWPSRWPPSRSMIFVMGSTSCRCPPSATRAWSSPALPRCWECARAAAARFGRPRSTTCATNACCLR
jgi:class 3 adenylate cyclase